MQTPATPGPAPTARSRRAFPATLSEGELRNFARACGEDVKQACKMFFLMIVFIYLYMIYTLKSLTYKVCKLFFFPGS